MEQDSMRRYSIGQGESREQEESQIYGRSLSARSAMASMLLGTEPPVLPSYALVRAGEFLGLSEGAVRTALSRMVASVEVIRSPQGDYQLTGVLAERQQRQIASLSAELQVWSGNWEMWVVTGGARESAERAELRSCAVEMRLVELRDGVWLRPDNLDAGRFPTAAAVLREQTQRFVTQPDRDDLLAARLWDLEGWSAAAERLRAQMTRWIPTLRAGDTEALRPGFLLAAAVLRHCNADPLLPRELLPREWQGQRLRRDYDQFDAVYRNLLSCWLRDSSQPPASREPDAER